MSVQARRRQPVAERELVDVALSRLLMGSKTPGSKWMYLLQRMVAVWAVTPLPIGDRVLPAPDPAAPQGGFHQSGYALRRLGLEWTEIQDQWERAVAAKGVCASLPRPILEGFVDKRLWPTLGALIREGPAHAWQRHEFALRAMANTPPLRSRSSHGEITKLSRGTMGARTAAMRRFMLGLENLRRLGHPSPLLKSWVGLPKAEPIPGRAVSPGLQAPEVRALRLAWQRTAAEIEHRFGPITSAADVIRAGGSRYATRSHRLLRFAVLLILLLVVGARREAVSRLNRGDFVRRGDGFAIALRPAKSLDAAQVQWKPVPRPAAYYIEAYMAYVAMRSEHELGYDSPLVVGMFRGRRRPTRCSVGAIRDAVARSVPRSGLSPPRPRRHREPGEGSHPHALRAAATQLIRDGGRAYCAEHGIEVEPSVLADVLLDHTIPQDRYGYLGISTPAGRERYSGVASQITWRMLTTDDGARRVIDATALRRAIRLRTTVAGSAARARARSEQLRREIAVLDPSGRPGSSVSGLVATVAKQLELQGVMDERHRLAEELARIDLEIEALERDPARRVAVADDVDAIHREEEGTIEVSGRRARLLRNWVTVPEFAQFAGVPEPTVRRWVRGRLPYREGDPRNPWPADDVPLVEVGPRRRAILAERISPGFLAINGRSERLKALLTTYPDNWSATAIKDASQRTNGRRR